MREVDLKQIAGFDQRGETIYQVTFPGWEHLWAALSINTTPETSLCWIGGAVVGRNPVSMPWGGPPGSKTRKNNFLLSESGRLVVEGVRLHNLHDAFLAGKRHAGFRIRNSWISWNRDDFFEGYLHDLTIENTLVDGTYTFVSDPDGDCTPEKAAASAVIVIENSLIRLQRQPGPYAAFTMRWHNSASGGHNTLWKQDSCGWPDWPRFVLRNNIFLIEGPHTSQYRLNEPDCRLALPGDCSDTNLSQLVECSNNLFLYTDFVKWVEAGQLPGPVPQPGRRWHNPNNPGFLPNGVDCYQRLTDDQDDLGFADVIGIWRTQRALWIQSHVDAADPERAVQQIPGVDYPVFPSEKPVTIASAANGKCLTSVTSEVILLPCNGSEQQRFYVESFEDGKLMAAILLKDSRGRYMQSVPIEKHTRSREDSTADFPLHMRTPVNGLPIAGERWYVLPLNELPSTKPRRWSVESDAVRRSFLQVSDDKPVMQSLYGKGKATRLPQPRFVGGNASALQWIFRTVPQGSSG